MRSVVNFNFSNSSIILPGLRASIGVTRSYSSRPFLCALVTTLFPVYAHHCTAVFSFLNEANHCSSCFSSFNIEELPSHTAAGADPGGGHGGPMPPPPSGLSKH